MEESRSGMSWIGVLFVIIVIWAVFGGGFGNGWGNRNGNGDYGVGGCNRVSNCEVEKNEIIDSARTQYLIEQQSAATRTAVRDGTDAVMGQASRIYEDQQSEKIFDLKMENQSLKSQLYSDAKFNALSAQMEGFARVVDSRLGTIECDMLKRPNLYGIASTCSGQIIPASFGSSCGCGNSWNGNNNI